MAISFWYYKNQLFEILGTDSNGDRWTHVSYAAYNEEKIGLPKGTTKKWCKETNYTIEDICNLKDKDEYFTFLHNKGYMRIIIIENVLYVTFSVLNKGTENCMDLFMNYWDTFKNLGTKEFVICPIDGGFIDFKSKSLPNILRFLRNL